MRADFGFKQRLKAGEVVVGTWSILASASVANVIAAAGFDFLITDMEHGPASFETLENVVRAMESEHKTPLCRVPCLDESLILRALETGVHGIIVPQIQTAEQAQAAVKAIKYFPQGMRGLSPYTRSAGYQPQNAAKYTQTENDHNITILLVEGVEGLQNLDQIAAVPGIDVIYLGIYDLSQAAGFPGEINRPEVISLVKNNIGRINSAGVSAGCLASSHEDIKKYIELGVQFLAYQADCAMLATAVSELAAFVKEVSNVDRRTT